MQASPFTPPGREIVVRVCLVRKHNDWCQDFGLCLEVAVGLSIYLSFQIQNHLDKARDSVKEQLRTCG